MRVLFVIGLCATIAVALFSGAASVALATSPLAPAAAVAAAPRLLFADEFDGPLDTGAWATLTPWYTNYTSGELEYYDPANVTVWGGKLHLASEESSPDSYSYTSGIVTSLPRAQFSYGYFEIRAKLPKGRGIVPAFWLTNDRTLEIDVSEMLGDRPRRHYMTLHEGAEQTFQRAFDGPDFSAGYHTYGVDWQSTYVRWYVDGVRRATYAHSMPADPLWICLNTAIGGAWPGSPDASTVFPQSYDIDYVRVWDKKPAARGRVSVETPAHAPATAPISTSVPPTRTASSATTPAQALAGQTSPQIPPSASPQDAADKLAPIATAGYPVRVSPSNEVAQTVTVDVGEPPSLLLGPGVHLLASDSAGSLRDKK